MGHTDPKLTLAVYQQVLDMGKGSVAILEHILGCTRAEARAIFDGEGLAGVSGTKPERGTKKPPPRPTRARGRLEKPAGLQGIPRKRMKGLEPSTFCMANGTLTDSATDFCLQMRPFLVSPGLRSWRPIRADFGGFSERTPNGNGLQRLFAEAARASVLEAVAVATCRSRAGRLGRRGPRPRAGFELARLSVSTRPNPRPFRHADHDPPALWSTARFAGPGGQKGGQIRRPFTQNTRS